MVVMAGAAAFISILIVWFTLLERDPGAKRAAAVAERYGTLKAALGGGRRRRKAEASVNIARRVVERLKLTRGRPTVKLGDRLAQAGLRSRDALVVFLFMKVVLPIVLGLAALSISTSSIRRCSGPRRACWLPSAPPASACSCPTSISRTPPTSARTRSANRCPTGSISW